MPLTVQVVTPEREVTVAEDATMIIAKGVEGDLGILPGRAPALIALGLGPLVIERGERREQLLLDGGFLTVKNDNVIVLAEYAVLPEDLEATEVDADIERLRQRLQQQAEDESARRELARAQAARNMLSA
ncbi:MAG TPA: ATP synthase F1 subunit epsilon [Actinomycetota bacterium]